LNNGLTVDEKLIVVERSNESSTFFVWSACDLKKQNMALPSKNAGNDEKSQEEPSLLGGAVIIVIILGLSIFKNICGGWRFFMHFEL